MGCLSACPLRFAAAAGRSLHNSDILRAPPPLLPRTLKPTSAAPSRTPIITACLPHLATGQQRQWLLPPVPNLPLCLSNQRNKNSTTCAIPPPGHTVTVPGGKQRHHFGDYLPDPFLHSRKRMHYHLKLSYSIYPAEEDWVGHTKLANTTKTSGTDMM